ncbi:MAG TPA: hypothetical protein VFN84_09640, partial [Pseudolabrys sp.]|nr:hypothetical protein [Pseudolabrys sp.]
MKLLLVVATVADGLLAALMVGVSGFFFGGGPESMRAGALAAAAYFAAVVACLAAPVVGFSLNGRGKAVAGLAVAWLPPAVA